MSVELVKEAIRNFLVDPTPEVLCIKGKWGTGKTYAWTEAVKFAASDAQQPIALKKYAYVSLFGVKNSSDIIQSVFANTNDVSSLNKDDPLPVGLGPSKIKSFLKRWKELSVFAAEHASVPYIAGLGGVARAVLSNLVAETLVCFDDFERKHKSVSINEVMGTIAQLRDARKCKVVLILNEDSFDDQEKAEFQRYSEKVINTSFKFEPTPSEAAHIAFQNINKNLNSILSEAACQLEITNIRILQKIHIYADKLKSMLANIDDDVVTKVIRSLIVIVWSIISPEGEGAPDIGYLLNTRGKQFFGNEKKDYSDAEIKWSALLDKYGFSHCDEFDLLLIEDIKNGFFNKHKITNGINTYLADTRKAKAEVAIEAAWRPFHASFDNNGTEVAQSIFEGCTENIMYLSPANLDGAVDVLKSIGFGDKARELLETYMKARGDEPIFDLSDNAFAPFIYITDPDIIAAFSNKAQVAGVLPTPLEAASRIYKGGWYPKDEEALAKLSVDDLLTLFKQTKRADRSVIILGCLKFKSLINATPRQQDIADNAHAALEQIARENPLNARRMRAYNISIEAQQAKSPAAEAST